MIRQVKTTKRRKLSTCMRGKHFVKGFNDKRKGKPMDYEAFPYDTNAQWDYERGRLFACIFQEPLKDGAKLRWQAQAAMVTALESGQVF